MNQILETLPKRICMKSCLIVFLTLLYFIPQSYAKEPDFLRQSIRARGMGNAFIAAVDDEMVLYYNPAALRSVRYNIYEILTLNLTTNKNTLNVASADNTESGLAEVTGKNLYNEFNLGVLSHTNSRWGWSLFSNGLANIAVHNPVFPYLETKAFVQGGALAGMAWSFMDYQLDVGLSGKVVNRSGLDTTFRLSDPAIVDAIGGNSKKLEEKFASETKSAPDFGVIYHIESLHNLAPKIAFTAQNIGGLDFGAAGKLPMTLNVGIATQSEIQGIDILFAADYHDLTDEYGLATQGNMSPRNFKMGLEFGFEKMFNGHHLFSLRVGQNGGYSTAGVTFNLFGFKVDLAQYSQETGNFAGDVEDKRMMGQISLIF